MPVSFPLLLSQSPSCFKNFLTSGCIAPIVPLFFLFLNHLSPNFVGQNPFHLVRNLIKHLAFISFHFKSTLHPPIPPTPLTSSSVFFLYFSYKTECIAKKTIWVFFFFLFPSSSQSQISRPTVRCKLCFLGSEPTSSFILYLIPLIVSFPLFALCLQTKSFEMASTKLGADMRMEMVHMMLKTLNATRHRRSITAPANFHWSVTLSASSCSRKRSAM